MALSTNVWYSALDIRSLTILDRRSDFRFGGRPMHFFAMPAMLVYVATESQVLTPHFLAFNEFPQIGGVKKYRRPRSELDIGQPAPMHQFS